MDLEEKIINQVKINNLKSCDYEFGIAQLCVLNNKPYDEIKKVVDKLILNKSITFADLSSFVKTKEPIKQVSKKPYNKLGKKYYKENTDFENNVLQAYEILNRKDSKKKVYKIQGTIQSTSKGYAFLIPSDPNFEDVFIAQKDLKGAVNNDVVVVEARLMGKRRPEGKVLQVIERGNEFVIGKISINKSGAYVTPDDVKFGKDIFVPLSKINGATNGYKVVVKVERYYNNKKMPDGIVSEVLGEPNELETEVKAIIRSYNLYETFPKKVSEVAKTIPTEINKKKYPNRLDLTKELIFTIDGEDTRDIDDAISLTQKDNGHMVLGVHIADVGEYVPRNSIIDKEAFKRGTSVYFPNLVLPMLPRELSNGICSLNEGVDRLALSVFIEYDENFKKVDTKITESIINSKKRFTYTEVYAILSGDETAIKNNKPFVDTLNKMNELAHALMDERKKAGYIEFDIPEVKVTLDLLGDVLKVQPRENNDSHKLIEAFMVAANEVVSEFFSKNKIPFVYRIHETPDEEKMQKFVKFIQELGVTTTLNPAKTTPLDVQYLLRQVKDSDYSYVVNRICLRSMRKAKYSPDCLGHFGLALKYYSHFTSPIRRYPDLTIHRIIKDYLRKNLNGSALAELKGFVLASSVNSSEREVNAEKVERDVDDLYKVMYMRNHLGEEYDGIISGVTGFGVFVELDNTVEGLLRVEDLPQDRYEFDEERYLLVGTHNKFTIGDKVRVKCVGANILNREIDFMLV